MKRKEKLLLGILLVAALMAAFFLIGASEPTQDKRKANTETIQTGYVEKADVRLVTLRAIVKDKKGRIVTNLKKEEFKLFEDYMPQKITHFIVDTDEPISVAFLLDVSGSMRLLDRIEEAKEAIRYFVNTLRKDDRFALYIFADGQSELVLDFTEDKEKFLSVLQPIYAYGQTALHDAVAVTPELVDHNSKGRKAIILISDGEDNFSRLTIDQAIVMAKAVDIPIYTIAFADLPEKVVGKKEPVPVKVDILSRFSQETGGLLFRVEDPDELKEACAQIEYELRHQYIIAYSPRRVFWEGEYRKLKLEATREGLTIRTRKGYLAKAK
ncbi:MAG: VWA domain-containing protein [Acidobacteriota bacterium]